jgi:hypothetical protein
VYAAMKRRSALIMKRPLTASLANPNQKVSGNNRLILRVSDW